MVIDQVMSWMGRGCGEEGGGLRMVIVGSIKPSEGWMGSMAMVMMMWLGG